MSRLCAAKVWGLVNLSWWALGGEAGRVGSPTNFWGKPSWSMSSLWYLAEPGVVVSR